MKKTKLLSLLALPLMLGGLTSCGPNAKYKVGVCQLVTHDALDAATQGFVDTLKEEFGDDVYIEIKNADGEKPNCVPIVNNFVSKRYSLIMANATPALQTAANATKDIPVLGTSVTDYGSALGIDDFDGTTGYNVSGTSDLVSIEEQVNCFEEIFPDAEKVGLLYCTSESNSLYQVEEIEKIFEEREINSRRISFTDSNDIGSVLDAAIASGVDTIYIPTDNTAASNASIIDSKCRGGDKKIPVFAAEEGLCENCGAVTLSLSYYRLGQMTGEMAISILKGEADITKMPVRHFESEDYEKKYNEEICDDLNITVPSDFVKI